MPKFTIAMQEFETHEVEDPEGRWVEESVCTADEEYEEEFSDYEEACKWCEENSVDHGGWRVYYCAYDEDDGEYHL